MILLKYLLDFCRNRPVSWGGRHSGLGPLSNFEISKENPGRRGGMGAACDPVGAGAVAGHAERRSRCWSD